MLKGSLKISRKLLSSLISLWVERRCGFLISNKVFVYLYWMFVWEWVYGFMVKVLT